MHDQFAAPDRLTQIILQIEPDQAIGMHAGLENHMTRPALGFGAVHRDIGVTQQNIGVALAGIAESYSNAGGDDEFPVTDLKWANEFSFDALGRLHRLKLGGELHYDHEFIATQPADSILVANAGLQAVGHFDEQHIAGLMAEAVLMSLKLSRSTNRTATLPCRRADRTRAGSRRSTNSARLGKPVSGSWKAC